ncbi:glycoside hydrolase family 19 protein [Pseudanabaena sp. FACHB-1277]|uniref:Glycoside hydrolase family 19 protein n=1 Tax=Pseudanabaena cinerea FACHB-1277 TaxID=2949581 RepID=A0A926Z5C9_9CYAN|nr:glycoside hydrolase family 19 protein [Pseudanabaena cinerea FACHB-1277]
MEVTFEQLCSIVHHAQPSRLKKLQPWLNQAMSRYEINTRLRQAHFIAQVAYESGDFNYLEELEDGADYEGRDDLGNTTAGDGAKFKGRGLFQITGRYNYTQVGNALGVDLISNPERLADHDLACLSAAWLWSANQLNEFADKDDIQLISSRANSGFNGLDARISYLNRAKQVFGI